jgi:homoaconitase/3-isopropylmalate dehydratase large subunit
MENRMNTDTRKTLLNLITEYGNCLTRIEGEKDMIKFIEARAVTECGVAAKAFKTVATAHHKDEVSSVLENLNQQVDLFDEIRDMSRPLNVVLREAA